jgi:hypothetical protein
LWLSFLKFSFISIVVINIKIATLLSGFRVVVLWLMKTSQIPVGKLNISI